MELHQLRYFLAVARTKNFSRGAEQCHVAQPSLSQQIMKLEDELGERLFERTKREVSLTPAGDLLRVHAERVLQEVELARDGVREFRGLVRGRVVLGVLPTVAPYFLPQRLRAFSSRFPAVEVVVPEMACTRPMRGVRFRTLAGMTRSIGIIHRKARPLSHASRALVDFLRDAAEGEPLKPARR